MLLVELSTAKLCCNFDGVPQLKVLWIVSTLVAFDPKLEALVNQELVDASLSLISGPHASSHSSAPSGLKKLVEHEAFDKGESDSNSEPDSDSGSFSLSFLLPLLPHENRFHSMVEEHMHLQSISWISEKQVCYSLTVKRYTYSCMGINASILRLTLKSSITVDA